MRTRRHSLVVVLSGLTLVASSCAVERAASVPASASPTPAVAARAEVVGGAVPAPSPLDPPPAPSTTTTTTTTTLPPNRPPRLAIPVSLTARPHQTTVAPLPIVDDDGDPVVAQVLGADGLTVHRDGGGWELRWVPTTTGTTIASVLLRDDRGGLEVVQVGLKATNRFRPDTLVGLGDSVASGHGLSKRDYLQADDCWRAGDEAYPRIVYDRLVEQGVFGPSGDHFNVACSGATLADLVDEPVGGGPSGVTVGGSGSQVDWAVASNPEVVTLTAGANTLGFVHPQRLLDESFDVDRQELDRRLADVDAGLEAVLERLVDHTDATVLVTNYYNPAGEQPQGVDGCRERCFAERATEVVLDFNATIAAVAARFPAERVVLVDIASRFEGHGAPNGLGPDGVRSGAVGWVRELIGAPAAGVHPYCAQGHDDEGSWINYVDCVHPDGRGHAEIAAAIVAEIG